MIKFFLNSKIVVCLFCLICFLQYFARFWLTLKKCEALMRAEKDAFKEKMIQWAVCTNCPIALTIEQLLLLWSNCSIVRALWLKFSFCSISFFSKSKSSMPKIFFGQLHQVCPSKMVTHAFQMGHLGSLKKIKKK